MNISGIDDFRVLARKRLPKAVFDLIEAGSGREVTVRRNRRALENLTFASRAFIDVAHRDLTTTVLGTKISIPVLAGPAAFATLVHKDGELAVARAAGKAGTIYCVSTASSYSLEEIAETGSGTLWFELLSCQPRDFALRLIERAQKARCGAIILAVDYRGNGIRIRNLRNRFNWPPKNGLSSLLSPKNVIDFALHPRWLSHVLRAHKHIDLGNLKDSGPLAGGKDLIARFRFVTESLMSETSTWDDLKWLRSQWTGRIVAHGIMSPDDAKKAADLGADGIIVSNHGGRHLDWVPATVEMLPSIVAAVHDRGTEVLVDGGIRHGADAVKALALGARACLVARPWFWALAAGGEAGVAAMFEILRTEIDNTLALLGRPRVTELDRSALLCSPPQVAPALSH